MTPSAEIRAAAAYLLQQAAASKSGAGLDVPRPELEFAAQRLRACAGDLLAGLHVPDAAAEVAA